MKGNKKLTYVQLTVVLLSYLDYTKIYSIKVDKSHELTAR